MVDEREDQSESIRKLEPQKSGVVGDHGNKLWIKLRLPKDEEEDHQEEDQQIEDDDDQLILTRFCHVCNKGFRSGKALGGHMRIHFQAHKKEPIFNKKPKTNQSAIIKFKKRRPKEQVTDHQAVKKKKKRITSNNKSTSGVAAASDGFEKIPTCLCCGKNFPSMKSLFGHMRCHPGRDWRGIHPPNPEFNTASSNSSLSDAAAAAEPVNLAAANSSDHQASDDLTKSLRGWPATAKRGRNSKTDLGNSSPSCSEEEEDEESREIALELMRLAHENYSFQSGSGLTNKQRVEEFEATNSNSLTYKNIKTENEDNMKWVSESKKRSFEESSVGYVKKQLRNEGRGFSDDGKMKGFRSNGRVIRDKAAAAQETGFIAGKSVTNYWPKEYEDKNCSEEDELDDSKNIKRLINRRNCESSNIGKVKKKRKKMKLRDLESVHDHDSPVHHQSSTPVTLTMAATTTTPPDKFRCTTCDKCFPTHQALGGHKSSHNKFRMIIQNSDVGEPTFALAADEDHDDNDHNLADYSPIPLDETKEIDQQQLQLDGTVVHHECKICNKNFSTGQALGGHKRCHWTTMEAQSSQGEVSHSGGGGRVLEFDLNEVPPPEDDAGFESENVAACGHASSSYTSVEFSSLRRFKC